jgi:ArsR family transcriptional regulator
VTKTQQQDLTSALLRLRALGDERRLRIVQLLARGERCVCELAADLRVAQPLLSFHLKTLKESGLVRVRRDGRWMHYSLDPQALEDLGSVLGDLAEEHRAKGALAVRCC